MDSDFVPIRINFIKTNNAKEETVPQEVIPNAGSQTLPVRRKFDHKLSLSNHEQREIRLPFGSGLLDSDLDPLGPTVPTVRKQVTSSKAQTTRLQRDRSLNDIDRDIAHIWKEIKEFEEVESPRDNTKKTELDDEAEGDNVPPPLPPKSPRFLRRSKSRLEAESPRCTLSPRPEHSHLTFPPTDQARVISKPPLPLHRSNSMPCRRHRKPEQATKHCDDSSITSLPDCSNDGVTVLHKDTELVEFKANGEFSEIQEIMFKRHVISEGLPIGVIVPEIPPKYLKHSSLANENDDGEEYFSADEESVDDDNKSYLTSDFIQKVDAASQTDPNPQSCNIL